jgi:hypothetical protein
MGEAISQGTITKLFFANENPRFMTVNLVLRPMARDLCFPVELRLQTRWHWMF